MSFISATANVINYASLISWTDSCLQTTFLLELDCMVRSEFKGHKNNEFGLTVSSLTSGDRA